MHRDGHSERCTLLPNVFLTSILTTRVGRAALKQRFGSDVFDDGSKYAGHFWDFVESRPYMRILQAMVRIAFTNKEYNKSAWVFSNVITKYSSRCILTWL
jgi:hypothetical protein